MNFSKTAIEDIFLIEPSIYTDSRGYFAESFRLDKLEDFLGYTIDFCQENESKSSRGVLRGLHYQAPPDAQTKLVRVVSGSVLDVAVDIRIGSPTFGKHISVELSSDNKLQLLVPRGFAHGFVALEDETILCYKVDNYYSSNNDCGILFNDPLLGIDWRLDHNELCISEKDKAQPRLDKLQDLFTYNSN